MTMRGWINSMRSQDVGEYEIDLMKDGALWYLDRTRDDIKAGEPIPPEIRSLLIAALRAFPSLTTDTLAYLLENES